jgi:hypothetical protein
MTYEEYIASTMWQRLRKQALERSNDWPELAVIPHT